MEVGAVKQAFNNEIIHLKKNLNQAKTQIIHKLTRKAKTFTEKKLPEPQKEKLKRKAESAVKEILIIKKVKPRDLAKFIVTHKGNLNDFINKPVNNEKAYAKLLLHKALQGKYKHIRDKFLDLPIKDLFMTREERRKLKKEAREKQKNKNKNKQKSKTVNVEGDWDVEMTDVKEIPPKDYKSSSDDGSNQGKESDSDDESEIEQSGFGENDEFVEETKNGARIKQKLKEVDSDDDENSGESSNDLVSSKNEINTSKVKKDKNHSKIETDSEDNESNSELLNNLMQIAHKININKNDINTNSHSIDVKGQLIKVKNEKPNIKVNKGKNDNKMKGDDSIDNENSSESANNMLCNKSKVNTSKNAIHGKFDKVGKEPLIKIKNKKPKIKVNKDKNIINKTKDDSDDNESNSEFTYDMVPTESEVNMSKKAINLNSNEKVVEDKKPKIKVNKIKNVNKIIEDSDNNGSSSESTNDTVSPKNEVFKNIINVPLNKVVECPLMKVKNKMSETKVNKNKNLNKKLEKRNFHKKSDNAASNLTKIVDPFFITSTGKNYVTLVEPRPPDEVKEIHKQGNRQYRRAVMFGRIPKVKPKRNNFDEGNDFYNANNSDKSNKINNGWLDKRQGFHGGDNKLNRRNEKDDAVQEKLHPSWEAKKKQSGILPFEGKKIVFDES